MDTSKILTGNNLVARGITKTNTSLPESGQKEISVSGTWLENKQIQSALDARKHLLEVERIEKLGSLSVALWRDDLRLAEVVKKAGSHWQYIGHNVGKHLYLRPEETLYLIEINNLYLKHNEVIVSLQKAYSLCLGEINIAQYKVYASLSRLGCRVFRHIDSSTRNNSEFNQKDNRKTSNVNNQVHEMETSENNQKESVMECTKSYQENNQSFRSVTSSSNIACNSLKVPRNINNTNNVVSSSNTVNEPKIYPVSSKIITTTKVENTVEQFIDENNVLVEIIEDHEGSEVSENQINVAIEKTLSLSGIYSNNDKVGDQISPISHGCERNAIVLGYNSNNFESTSIIEGMDGNDIKQKPKTVPKEKDKNKSQNTVIVKMKNNEKMDIEENTEAIETKNISISDENIDSLTTVIVSTKNNANMTVKNDPDAKCKNVRINEKINRNINKSPSDNDSPELNIERPVIIYSVDMAGVIRVSEKITQMEIENEVILENSCEDDETSNQNNNIDNLEIFFMNKMQKLQERRNQINPTQKTNESDKLTLPDCFDRKIVTVKSPHVQYLPRNIFLMKTTYLLDLEAIKRLNSKNRKDSTTESSDGDCINEPRRLPVTGTNINRSDNQGQPRHIITAPVLPMYPLYFTPPIWCPRPVTLFNNYVRPRYPIYRPIVPNFHINTNNVRPRIFDTSNPRKRGNPRFKAYHLRVIKKLADKFKVVYAPTHVQDLIRLVNTFNEQYDERYQLTEDFKLVDLNEIQEVIDLDDGEPKSKKSRPNDDSDKINKHLETLKCLAAKLKDLEAKKLAISRHRRVLSNAIKAFNKNFNADIYLNSNFEIIDSKLITLDSSSDSDSVVAVENHTKGKKLRNPFSFIKNSERINEGASTSRGVPILQQLSLNIINDGISRNQNTDTEADSPVTENTGIGLLKFFKNAWLPSDDDFGRAEIRSREEAYFFDVIEAEYLYAYFKYRTRYFENWLDLKIAFMKQAQERIKDRKERAINNNILMNDRIQPLVGQDCIDIASVLKKLQIISSSKTVASNSSHSSIEVDFDVYYGHSPHFRKANRPKPDFRVLCIDVSDDFLSSQHIEDLCTKYIQDNVPLMFGAVGVGSISYIQLNHTDIPVYIPDSFY